MNSGKGRFVFKGNILLYLIIFSFIACSKDAPFGIIQSEIAPPSISVGKDKYISSLQDTVTFTTVSNSAEILTP